MGRSDLVLGLIDASRAGGPLGEKSRDLSIAWSRYGYRDSIIERESIGAILDEASHRGHRYCLILAPGVLIRESWRGEGEPGCDFLGALARWLDSSDFFAAGRIVDGGGPGHGLDDRWLVVDLARYRELGCPEFGLGGRGFVAAAQRAKLPVQDLESTLVDQLLDIGSADASSSADFSRYLGDRIADYTGNETARLSGDQHQLLDTAALHSANARRGVFLWNIEPYDDVEAPPRDFTEPVTRLYSVAAGFKPNRILETHGFDQRTSVVFFDYSQRALDVRRFTVDTWNGKDFPRFVRGLFERFPFPGTYYHLWRDLTPDQVSAADLESAWRREIVRWGGEEAFAEHWGRYCALPHEFVHCDVVGDPGPLLERMEVDASSVVWWSNAFFTVHSNWHYSWSERRDRYEAWVSGLVDRNPELLVYGSDHNNSNVNWIRIGEYWTRYREMAGDELVPRKLQHHEIRM